MKQTGFASEHFPRLFIDTYQYFSNLTGRKSSAQEKEILWKLGMSIYEMDIKPYSGMIDVLQHLQAARHDLYLYTGGKTIIQQRKIKQMNLFAYFADRISFSNIKQLKH